MSGKNKMKNIIKISLIVIVFCAIASENALKAKALVWINNSYFTLIYFLLVPIFGLILLALIAIFESDFFIKLTIYYIFITVGILFCFLSGSGRLADALRGEYGQHLVETKQFAANKNAKELQKLSKRENSSTVTVWKGKKKYDAVKVKCREGKEEKIVFAYPEPTIKGIKVLSKDPYIYVYHKKPNQPKYRFE